MKKRNKYILGGIISTFVLLLLTILHLYTYSNKKINEIKNDDCWNENGY